MLKFYSLLTVVFLSLQVDAFCQPVPFDPERWEIRAEESRLVDHLGRKSLFLKGGVAAVKDAQFTDGVIEFDIAFTEERGFMGAVWRMQDFENYKEFYFRPHQSGQPDANQYQPVFNGLAAWQLYYGDGYAVPVRYDFISDLYRSRDHRFLGTIGLFDELYLPLKKGDNELWLAVSENFGGWGVKALIEDMSGMSLKK